jgi:ABC-2 type transport system ATP-binding protein
MIRCTSLAYDYPGKRALHDISFEIAKGTITALVGPNGAGKTTLLRCLAVLEQPFAGGVAIDGVAAADEPRACHAKLGYLADNFGLYDSLTVRQCLAYHAAIHGMAAADRPRAIDWAVERMELGPLLGQLAGTLSRGERQRLGVAQAIIHFPKVLLLDEPASGLDPEARWKLSSLLTHLADEGLTLVVSSHILSELQDYSTHVLILREGRVVRHQPLAEAERGAGAALDGHTCLRVELAASDARLDAVIRAFAPVKQATMHGRSATVFLPEDAAIRAAFLRHLVAAGIEVVGFAEDKSRVQDIYFTTVAAEAPKP